MGTVKKTKHRARRKLQKCNLSPEHNKKNIKNGFERSRFPRIQPKNPPNCCPIRRDRNSTRCLWQPQSEKRFRKPGSLGRFSNRKQVSHEPFNHASVFCLHHEMYPTFKIIFSWNVVFLSAKISRNYHRKHYTVSRKSLSSWWNIIDTWLGKFGIAWTWFSKRSIENIVTKNLKIRNLQRL